MTRALQKFSLARESGGVNALTYTHRILPVWKTPYLNLPVFLVVLLCGNNLITLIGV